MQLEGFSSLGNNEGDGVVGAQAAPQDPLLSLLRDLGDDIIDYQEAVPSTDGAEGRVLLEKSLVRMHCTLAGHRMLLWRQREWPLGHRKLNRWFLPGLKRLQGVTSLLKRLSPGDPSSNWQLISIVKGFFSAPPFCMCFGRMAF